MPTIERAVNKFSEVIIQPLIILLFALAILVFLWGIFEFIRDAESSDGREKGKQHMIYGIIGIVIMVAVWGIIGILKNTFGI